MTNARCYVISTYESHANKCVSIVETHQVEYGGRTCGDYYIHIPHQHCQLNSNVANQIKLCHKMPRGLK